MSLESFEKGVSETLDYIMDWSTWLGSDTISSSSWVVPNGLTTGTASNTTTTATQFVGGGQVGNDYVVTNTIVTAGGRTATRGFKLTIVRER